jgi:hypothetical protein
LLLCLAAALSSGNRIYLIGNTMTENYSTQNTLDMLAKMLADPSNVTDDATDTTPNVDGKRPQGLGRPSLGKREPISGPLQQISYAMGMFNPKLDKGNVPKKVDLDAEGFMTKLQANWDRLVPFKLRGEQLATDAPYKARGNTTLEPMTNADASPLLSGTGVSSNDMPPLTPAEQAGVDVALAAQGNGLMARPASDAAPTAIESPATPEVAASQAGAWLTTAVDAILLTEGGYQKDLEDTGNYRPDGTLVGTNRGVTALALAAYKGVDANTITEADIKAITDQDAKDIFIEDYYYKPKIDKLPDNIKEAVFDMNINSGSNSITILQRLAGLTGDAVDGGVGPDTLKAIEKANITPDQYADARIKYYKEVVKKTPAKKKYLDGWINRANEYRE